MVDLSETFEYSEAEKKLFTKIGVDYLMDCSIVPVVLWDLAVDKAFIDDQRGIHVDALRRGLKAIKACKPYRLTPEFEALITY